MIGKQNGLFAVGVQSQFQVVVLGLSLRGGADDAIQRYSLGGLSGRCVRHANRAKDIFEIESPHVGPENEQAQDEPCVAHAIGDERLVGGVGSALTFVVEADQQE